MDTLSKKQIQQIESLNRIQSGLSMANYAPILKGFMEKGIAIEDIKPRENVLTFNAWKALKRTVKKGEHGVKVVTFIETKGTEDKKPAKLCRSTTVFHISQTQEIE